MFLFKWFRKKKQKHKHKNKPNDGKHDDQNAKRLARDIIHLSDEIDQEICPRLRRLNIDLQKIKLKVAAVKDRIEEAVLNDPNVIKDIAYALRSLNNVIATQTDRVSQLVALVEMIEIIETHGGYYKLDEESDGFFEVVL